MSAYKVFRGVRGAAGASVTVDGEPLPLEPSLAIIKHSPTGFEWGYGGSGPAQLALAILLACKVGPAWAEHVYQDFKDAFIAKLPRRGGWELREEDIWVWLDGHPCPHAGDIYPAREAASMEYDPLLGWVVNVRCGECGREGVAPVNTAESDWGEDASDADG